ncbi:MAG: hypothetical protein ACYTJ0_08060 [Planctomycetota bacterium]|jgi:hypothetical protein
MSVTAEIPRNRAITRRVADDRLTSPAIANAVQINGQPVRLALVLRVRAAIAAGTYETGQKLDIALDRLLRDVGPGVQRRSRRGRHGRRRHPIRNGRSRRRC